MRVLVVPAFVILGSCSAALGASANINFTGTVLTVCALTLSTDGTLGLSPDGETLSSDGTLGGLPGSVTILSIGSGNTIEVGAPQRLDEPGGYDDSDETLEVRYEGLSGLSWVDQDWTTQSTTFNPQSIAASVLTVHNRIVNPNGFVAGSYQTRTVVTCAP